MDGSVAGRAAGDGLCDDARAKTQRRGRRRRDVLELDRHGGIVETPLELVSEMQKIIVSRQAPEAEHAGDEVDAVHYGALDGASAARAKFVAGSKESSRSTSGREAAGGRTPRSGAERRGLAPQDRLGPR